MKNKLFPCVFALLFMHGIATAAVTPLQCTSDVIGSIAIAGEKDTFSFTAAVGERFILRMADGSGSSIYPHLDLYAPSGIKIGDTYGVNQARLDVGSAPEAGTYIAVASDYDGIYTGSYGLSLQGVKAVCTEAVLSGSGDLGNESIDGNAAMRAYQFTASAGERIILRMAKGSGSSIYPRLELYSPGGSKLGEHYGVSLARLDVGSAPETGTYIVVAMDEDGLYTGSYGVSLQIVTPAFTQNTLDCPANDLGNEAINGDAAMNAYQFMASAGEQIILRMAKSSGSGIYPHLELYSPGGSKLGEHYGVNLARLDVNDLTESGTYIAIAMDEYGLYTGGYGVSLQVLRPACSTPIPSCPYNTNGSILNDGEMDAYVFYASIGDNLTISVDNLGSDIYPAIQVFDPLGNLVGATYDVNSATLDLTNLGASGNYFLVVYDENGLYTGNYSLSMTGCSDDPVPACVAPIFAWAPGTPVTVCAGSPVSLELLNPDANFRYELYRDGVALGNYLNGDNFTPFVLNQNATFSVTATLKADSTCQFDLDPPLTIQIGALGLDYSVENETAQNDDGGITLCVSGGAPPFSLEYEPQRGTAESLPAPCAGNFEISGLRAGYYLVTVADNGGCAARDTIKVDNPDKDRIGFPGSPLLTPNGDGLNDQLVFDGLYQASYDSELIIFNRYGSVIYRAKPYLNDWGAIFEGNALPADTYHYTLRLFGAEETVYIGFITVVR